MRTEPLIVRLSRSQAREIDRRASEEYHLPSIVLMENAAIAAANAACDMLETHSAGQILILCGGGNNGGDGLAVARHLHNRGADVSLALTIDPARFKGDALVNWQVVSAMRIPRRAADGAFIAAASPRLIIDAVFGTGLTQAPRDPFPAIAAAVLDCGAPVLAIDLPSGMDCDSGLAPGACIKATRTITFVAEKIGFSNPAARDYLGKIQIGSIGCPRELIDAVWRSSLA